jgi:hypothetical protein
MVSWDMDVAYTVGPDNWPILYQTIRQKIKFSLQRDTFRCPAGFIKKTISFAFN